MLRISYDFSTAVVREIFGFVRVRWYNRLPPYARDAGKDEVVGRIK